MNFFKQITTPIKPHHILPNRLRFSVAPSSLSAILTLARATTVAFARQIVCFDS